MTDKHHDLDSNVKYETISYQPSLQNTGDLEAATKTITAASKGAAADYSANLTLPSPTDVRLAVLRIASRLSVTRDSGSSAHLYCSVYVDSADGSDANKRLFNAVDIQAGNLAAVTTHAANLATIFNLLKDGAAHTFYFFFWVDSGNSVISLVQLWEYVGDNDTGYNFAPALKLTYSGLAQVVASAGLGMTSGLMRTFANGDESPPTYSNYLNELSFSTAYTQVSSTMVPITSFEVGFRATAATDIAGLLRITMHLRSDV
jgi:hypothetical protein